VVDCRAARVGIHARRLLDADRGYAGRWPAGGRGPKEAGGYLPVHDLPPNRDEEAIKPAELAKIQSELTAARDRQATASTPAKPAKK